MRVVLALLLSLWTTATGAELTLSPLRQVLTEEKTTATYRASNPSSRIIEARVSWIDMQATETGYVLATPEQRAAQSAAPFLTVSPASFKLEPGAATTITVALREDIQFPHAERRSHLLIETGAARTPLRKAGGLELDIGIGVSTPVVLRPLDGKAEATIGETRLLRDHNGLLELSTRLHSAGTFSAYGQLEARLTTDSEEFVLADITNVALWTDAPSRSFTLPLRVEYLPRGVLKLRYIGAAEYEGRVFAEKSFEVAPPR